MNLSPMELGNQNMVIELWLVCFIVTTASGAPLEIAVDRICYQICYLIRHLLRGCVNIDSQMPCGVTPWSNTLWAKGSTLWLGLKSLTNPRLNAASYR